jgi:hypothetical protein
MEESLKIPREIADNRFSLEEIGTLVVLMSSPNLDEKASKFWDTNENFQLNFQNLKDRGFITLDKDDEGANVLNINMEAQIEQENNSVNKEIRNILRELGSTWDLTTETLNHIEELVGEALNAAYYTGYDDRRIEEEEAVKK